MCGRLHRGVVASVTGVATSPDGQGCGRRRAALQRGSRRADRASYSRSALPGMRSSACAMTCVRRAGAHDLAAGVAAFGAEVDDPVGCARSRRGCARSPAANVRPRSACGRRAAAWRRRRSAGRWSARRRGTACRVPCSTARRRAGRRRRCGCASARCPASFSRCASPPDSVGTGWPSFR